MKTLNYLLAIAVLSINYSCDKDDEENDPPETANYSYIVSEEGSDLTMEYPDGSKKPIGTDFFVGWNGGQLFGNSYFRQLRIGTEEGTMDFRLSMPEDVSFADVVEGTHELSPHLLLQESGSIEEEVAELWIGGSDFDDNATGTVKIEQDINHEEQNYDVVGEVNATFYNSSGQAHIVTGHFWSNDAD